jgi:translation initiation factor IF-2
MPGRLSAKVVCLLAATAFVGAFRLNAGGGDSTDASASPATLSTAQATALRTDTTVRRPAAPKAAALATAPGLPALHRGPARPHKPKHHTAHKPAAAAPRVVAPAPTATPAPTAVPVAPAPAPAAPRPAAPAPKPKPKYVGQSFDSQG